MGCQVTHRTLDARIDRSETFSREIDPVLFVRLLTTDNFPLLLCSMEHWKILLS